MVFSLILSACKPEKKEVEVIEAIPTIELRAKDQEDQKLLDELNQYQDKALDTDFSEIESQL